MTVIVAGKIIVKPGQRDEFMTRSMPAVVAARQAVGCDDFSVSTDPVEENRVNICEKWSSRQTMFAFRESGPDDDLFSLIESIDVMEYQVVEDDTSP